MIENPLRRWKLKASVPYHCKLTSKDTWGGKSCKICLQTKGKYYALWGGIKYTFDCLVGDIC